jgi:hypothetical protein
MGAIPSLFFCVPAQMESIVLDVQMLLVAAVASRIPPGSHTFTGPYTAFQVDLGSPVNRPKVASNAPDASSPQNALSAPSSPEEEEGTERRGDHPSTRARAASASRISLTLWPSRPFLLVV